MKSKSFHNPLFAAVLVLVGGCGMANAQNPTTQPAAATETRPVKVHVFNRQGELVAVDSPKVVKTDAEWRKLLTPEQFAIARSKGTEAPFCGTLLDNKKHGVYTCVCCG